jgi:glycosyltransferase involved in cell wall biosynthesis
MSQISVIIPTFNRAEVLRRTLNLLATQTLSKNEFEVIVIDDGSVDETPRLLAEFQAKQVIDLRFVSQKNAGQGVARNQGIAMAADKILLFLGDDMLPQPDLLEMHLRFHILHAADTAGCLGLVEWHPELEINRFMRWLMRSGAQFKFHNLRRGQLTNFWRFYTANLSLKRALLGTERFDSDFHGWGYEDAELGCRLQKKGLQLFFESAALVQHLHAMNADDLAERQYQAGQNAVLFQKKHPDVEILPRGAKLFIQKILAKLLPFTFWGRAKRAFLEGISTGAKDLLK